MYMPCLFPSSTDHLNNVLIPVAAKDVFLVSQNAGFDSEKRSISIEQLLPFLYIRIGDFIILLFRVRFTISKFKSCNFYPTISRMNWELN